MSVHIHVYPKPCQLVAKLHVYKSPHPYYFQAFAASFARQQERLNVQLGWIIMSICCPFAASCTIVPNLITKVSIEHHFGMLWLRGTGRVHCGSQCPESEGIIIWIAYSCLNQNDIWESTSLFKVEYPHHISKVPCNYN